MILAIKTDQPIAEIYLLDKSGNTVRNDIWQADRQLSQDILSRIVGLLKQAGGNLSQLSGLVVFEGPGSFTGLRIGISVANALAYAQHVPIVGASGAKWLVEGVNQLPKTKPSNFIQPQYGAPPRITQPRK